MFLESLPLAPVLASLVCIGLVSWLWTSTKPPDDDIPWAPGAIPLLGHALQYKQDPVGFLQACQNATRSPVFRINLAGQNLIVLVDFHGLLASQPESILSLRQAVVDYGFCETLGYNNVWHGTEFHKRVIRQDVAQQFQQWTTCVQSTLADVLEHECQNLAKMQESNHQQSQRLYIPDLVEFTRRCMTRVVLQAMVGLPPAAVSKDLVDDILAWQIRVEDATAATAVLPHWLAHYLVLRPTSHCRLRLQHKVAQILQNYHDSSQGIWVQALRRQDLSIHHQAEFILGLLFAGAKNPSLGAAQTLCFLLQHPDWLAKVRTESEEKAWLPKTSTQSAAELSTACPVGWACIREATRLTALVIGGIRKVQKPLQITTPENKLLSLKPGETVALSLLLPNLNPQVWGRDAQEFRPDRFLVDQPKAPTLVTFSQGTHHCPGERIAMVLMHSFMSYMLCKYDLQSQGPIPGLVWERPTLAQRDGPVPVSVQWTSSVSS